MVNVREGTPLDSLQLEIVLCIIAPMTTPETTPIIQAPDWRQIEADYRAGIKPLRQIASENGITEGGIRKRAKKLEWARDLAGKIHAQADALVRKEAVRNGVRAGTAPSENTIVTANAELQYRIRMEHRADIGRARKLFQTLLAELELSCTQTEQIKALFDEVHPAPSADAPQSDHGRYAKLSKALSDVLSIPGRVESGKKITEMLEKLVRLEREAFGIKTDEGGGEVKSRVVFLPVKDAE